MLIVTILVVWYSIIILIPGEALKDNTKEQLQLLEKIIPILYLITFISVAIKLGISVESTRKKKAQLELVVLLTIGLVYCIIKSLLGIDPINTDSSEEMILVLKTLWPITIILLFIIWVYDSLVFFIRRKRPDAYPSYGAPSRYHRLLSKFFRE